MKPSDKGDGIYEYCLDRPYEYIAFMAGTDGWDYTEATTPVYTEWDFQDPCFVLEKVDGEESTGSWVNLHYIIYFDASKIKEDPEFLKSGVSLYAWTEQEGDRQELSAEPVRMIASSKGEDIYQYTLDQAYDHVQFSWVPPLMQPSKQMSLKLTGTVWQHPAIR